MSSTSSAARHVSGWHARWRRLLARAPSSDRSCESVAAVVVTAQQVETPSQKLHPGATRPSVVDRSQRSSRICCRSSSTSPLRQQWSDSREVGETVQQHSVEGHGCVACHGPGFLRAPRSSLPQDSSVFEWYRNAVAVWYQSRRIVRRRTGRGYLRAVSESVGRSYQLPHALHLHSLR